MEVREALWSEFAKLHCEVLAIVKGGPGLQATDDGTGCRCRRGADLPRKRRRPGRFAKSKSVGAFFGLVPKRY